MESHPPSTIRLPPEQLWDRHPNPTGVGTSSCLDGTWAKALPKALRWGVFHAPGRLVRRARRQVVRILDGWPSADALVGAYTRIAAIT